MSDFEHIFGRSLAYCIYAISIIVGVKGRMEGALEEVLLVVLIIVASFLMVITERPKEKKDTSPTLDHSPKS